MIDVENKRTGVLAQCVRRIAIGLIIIGVVVSFVISPAIVLPPAHASVEISFSVKSLSVSLLLSVIAIIMINTKTLTINNKDNNAQRQYQQK